MTSPCAISASPRARWPALQMYRQRRLQARADDGAWSWRPPELMKVIERSRPVPDLEPIGGGDRGGDVGLCLAHGVGQCQPLGETGIDGRRQRAAAAVCVLGGHA